MINYQKYLFHSSFLSLCVGSILLSSSASAESFRDALSNALQYHPSVEAAQSSQQNIKDQKLEQWSANFPEVNLNATAGRVYGDNATSRGLSVTRGSGYSYLWEGSAGITQKIFDGFETGERIEAAEDRYRSAKLSIIDVRENLALQTAQAYFDVMRTKEVLGIVKDHNAQIEDYKNRISLMVNEGVADQGELALAEDITILLDNIMVDYNAQHYAAAIAYEQLTGAAPSGDMSMPSWDRTLLPDEQNMALEQLAAHPSIQAADYLVSASMHDVDAEKATFYPDVNGELSYFKKEVDDVIGGEVDDARAVVKMSWNFSTGGAQYARIRQRQATKFETEAEKRQLERELTQSLGQAWVEYTSAAKILSNMQRRREINSDLFNTNNVQFEGGQIRLLQLMQSENQYFQTQIDYINAIYRQKLSELSVLASLGMLQQAFEIQVPENAAFAGD